LIYEIIIRIPFRYENICLSILKAIQPDNMLAPKGIDIEMICQDSILKIIVKGIDVNVLTIRNTVEDIFMHLLSAYKVLINAKGGGSIDIKAFKRMQ